VIAPLGLFTHIGEPLARATTMPTQTKSTTRRHSSLPLRVIALLSLASSACTESEDSLDAMDEMRSFECVEQEPITDTPPLLGQWTFEPGSELNDATGRWGKLRLFGNASISNGQLHLHGSGTTASGWAHAPGYSGGTIREKTLVSWVALDNLAVRAGSAMTIDNISGDNFDAIVYAERVAYRWMAGSSYFRRTQDVVTQNESSVGEVLQMAVSYRDLGNGNVEVTICRDGVQIGKYNSANMAQWTGGNAEILFGKRHTSGNYQPGAIEGRIEEARIYGGAMTCAQIADLPVLPDRDGDGVPDCGDVCDGFDDHLDDDLDETPDGCDLCRGDNETLDVDGDGVCGDLDVCFGDDQSGDFDADAVCDSTDNCVSVPNPDQADSNQDGMGDACSDEDSDGVLDPSDNCVSVPNPDQADSELDGIGDVCDDDDDNDDVPDASDNCVLLVNADQLDTDVDGQGDACDGDDDGDNVLDEDDACAGTPTNVEFDAQGCSGAQYVALSCGSCVDYPNEGLYQSCVAQASKAAQDQGLLDNKERAGIVRAAAVAPCP
jgi:hypothetical protein